MSAIHFDITGDNDNIMSVIDDTVKGFEKMAEQMKAWGQAIDLSDAEHAVEQLGEAWLDLHNVMKEGEAEMASLRTQLEEAMMAGDPDKVAEIGNKIKGLAQNMGEAGTAAQRIETILDQTDGGKAKLEELRKTVGQIPAEVNKGTSAFGNLFRSILPGVAKLGSIAGIVAILKGIANTAIGLTQRVGDAWSRETSGWKSSYEAFVRSIGSGKGFTELINDMTRAYTIGKKVFDLMDELFEMQNSLTIQEANYNGQIEENRQIMMDTTKSYAERKKAAEEIIKIETKLGEMRQRIADQKLEAATLDLEKDTNLTEEERDFFITQYNDNQEIIQQAMKYKKVREDLAQNEKAYAQTMFTNYGNEAQARQMLTEQAEEYNKIIGDTPQAIKDAYEILLKYEEGSDRVIQNWVEARAAADSVSADTQRSTRRAETMKNRMELQERKSRQAYRDTVRRRAIQDKKDARTNELDQAQARIDAMKDGNEKVLAQIDLDYEKEKQSIQDWYDNLREEKINKARELFNANPSNQGSVFTYNANDSKWDATEGENALLAARNSAADTKYQRQLRKAMNAEDDTLNEYLKQYGSYWEQRLAIQKEYQDKIDASEDEWEKKSLDREKRNQLRDLERRRDYLSEADDYESRRIMITGDASDRIADLLEEQADLEKKLLEAKSDEEAEYLEEEIVRNLRTQQIINENTKNALDDLEEEYSDFYSRLSKDRSDWIVGDTVSLLNDAETRLAGLGDESTADNDTVERIQRLKAEVRKLKEELEEKFTPAGILKALIMPGEDKDNGRSLKQRLIDFKDAWNKLNLEQKGKIVGGYFAEIGDALSRAANALNEIADISGDGGLANTAEMLGGIGGMISSVGQGFAQGGVIGGAIAGITSVVNATIDAFVNAAKQEAIAAKVAEDWKTQIEMLSLIVKEEDFSTIFGDKSTALGQAKYREAIKVLEVYNKKVNELRRSYMKTYDASWWAELWGGMDKYNTLQNIAPEIFNDGGLDVDAARAFLEVETRLTEKQREQINNAIELKEQYDAAIQTIDDLISGTFGSLASDITDIIWDSVMNGTDAWQNFKEVGAEAITSIGKQLIQEMLITEYLEQYRERMRQAYNSNNATETQSQLRNIISDIFGGMEQMLAAGSLVAEEYKAWGEQHGFDLTKLTAETQNATAGGFQTMSQDTASELNGRFTALQLSNELISQSAQAGLEFLSSISTLVGIGNSTLTEIRQFHMIEAAHLEDISKYTKAMVGFGETLDRIKENTDRL